MSEEDRLLLERHADLAVGQHLFHDIVRLIVLVLDGHEERALLGLAVRPEVLGEALTGQIDHTVGGR